MPHNVLEYSSDLTPLPDFRWVFAEVHRALEEEAGIRVGNAKSRARPVDAYIGDGNGSHAMVHLDIRFMEGRTTDAKAALSARCLEILKDAFGASGDGRDLQITVAVADLERATYSKHPSGTIP
jgi:5-carboxymethyl-2-hydroxymuconate isomerase